MAIPLWAGTVILGFCHKIKSSLAHFLPQGTPIPLIPILVIIETISLFIQPIALAIRLTANITAGHLLIHLISGATLALLTINPTTAFVTFIILVLLTILEFAVALIQAYVFTLLVSLYLHDNT
jgi:F-type H+-transporting ATPase subunit a